VLGFATLANRAKYKGHSGAWSLFILLSLLGYLIGLLSLNPKGYSYAGHAVDADVRAMLVNSNMTAG
jgi:hypothetical protein